MESFLNWVVLSAEAESTEVSVCVPGKLQETRKKKRKYNKENSHKNKELKS